MHGEQVKVAAERAVLVAVMPTGRSDLDAEPLAELRALAETAGAEVVGELIQKRVKPRGRTHLGRGQGQELDGPVAGHRARLGAAAPRPAPPAPVRPAAPELRQGRAAGVDRRSAQRLTRGQLPVEAALDLHGHTQDQAHAALERFLSEVQTRGLRCVLVITGKGTTKEAGGVLRAQVPRWLNEPANRVRILAFDYAQPKDGGLGALYVLIRRKRGG